MRSFCARALPFVAGASFAVELDKVCDLQTLERPLAYVVVLFVAVLLLSFRRERA